MPLAQAGIPGLWYLDGLTICTVPWAGHDPTRLLVTLAGGDTVDTAGCLVGLFDGLDGRVGHGADQLEGLGHPFER